jgi:hypothetical protein
MQVPQDQGMLETIRTRKNRNGPHPRLRVAQPGAGARGEV